MTDEILSRLRGNLAFWRNERDVAAKAMCHASGEGVERARARFDKASANFDQMTTKLKGNQHMSTNEILDRYEFCLMAKRKRVTHWDRAVVNHKLEAVLELRELFREEAGEAGGEE